MERKGRGNSYLNTALDVKRAIDAAHRYLKPLGTCWTDYCDWIEGHETETIFDRDDEKGKYRLDMENVRENGDIKEEHVPHLEAHCRIKELETLLDDKEYHEWSFLYPVGYSHPSRVDPKYSFKVRRNGELLYEGSIEVDQMNLRKLYERAVDSPFGDMKTMETRVDKDVRDARELTEIEVSDALVEAIEKKWKKAMKPADVTAVPYKLNLYTDKGFFKTHKDTPDKDLVGTVLVSLWKYDAGTLPYLELYPGNETKETKWDPWEPSGIAFYTDVPHRLCPVKPSDGRPSSSIRATLAFKVYANGGSVADPEQELVGRVATLLRAMGVGSRHVGLMLSHDYTLGSKGFKGRDHYVCEAVKKMGVRYEVVTVREKSVREGGFDSEPMYYDNRVYRFEDRDIEEVLRRLDQPDLDDPLCSDSSATPTFDFYSVGKRKIWSQECQDECEYTGNEAQAEKIDTVYVSRALLIYPTDCE